MGAPDGKPVTEKDEKEAMRLRERTMAPTMQNVATDGTTDPLVGAPGSPELVEVERCPECGRPLDNPSESLATG